MSYYLNTGLRSFSMQQHDVSVTQEQPQARGRQNTIISLFLSRVIISGIIPIKAGKHGAMVPHTPFWHVGVGPQKRI